MTKQNRLWTEEEIEYLRGHYHTTPFIEISKHINRSERAIKLKANSLGLIRERREYIRWTREEVAYLEQNYGHVDTEIIAKKLGKNVDAVRQKANKLDLFIDRITPHNPRGVMYKCTYIDIDGQKKIRESLYPTERFEKKAALRAIDCLTKMMGYRDVKMLEVKRL